MLDLKSPEINFAIRCVRQSCWLVRQIQAELVTPALTKADNSPVTVADFACQALASYLLKETFPDDPLVAEETSTSLQTAETADTLDLVSSFVSRVAGKHDTRQICEWIDRGQADTAERFWTLDPIDGTKGFLRGDQFAVALALIENDLVQLGVLGCPNLVDGQHPDLSGPGSLVIAVRGQGTWSTSLTEPGSFSRLMVSECSEPAEARILRSFEAGHTNVDQIDLFQEALGVRVAPVRMDSQAKYAVLAAGGGDLLLRLLSPTKPDYREKIWDQAAGSLVLEEAGGQITDLDGKMLDFSTGRTLSRNRGILASNGTLHAFAQKALRQIGA
jgi:HAL2 family 3'(2'),5'-bisphosphate nucleotidase